MILRENLILMILAVFSRSIKETTGSSSNLLAVFPKTFQLGSPLVVTCNLLRNGQKQVQLSLLAKGMEVLQNSSVVTHGKQSSIIINVPPRLSSFDISMAKLTYGSESILSPIEYDPVTCLIFIQTDRGIYAEKEEVKLRIILLRPDLKPLAGKFNVEIFDGKNKIVQQWLDVHGTNGVYGKKFNIPIDANLGTWRIVVDVLKTQSEKTIEVRNYVVPKFKVSITCPKKYARTTKELTCRVSARYFFGKTVSGIIHLHISTQIKNADVVLCDKYTDIVGVFQKATPLNPGTNLYETDIFVFAKVSDPSTGTTVIDSVTIPLERDVTMTWTLEPKRDYFQPGLPFITFIKFPKKNNFSISVIIEIVEETLKNCSDHRKYRLTSNRLISKTLIVDNQGYGKLSLNLQSHVTELNIMTHHGADKEFKRMHAATNNLGIVILPEKPYTEVGRMFTFEIVSKNNITGPLWFIISSRGSILKNGHCGKGIFSRVKCPINIEPSFYPGFQILFYYGKQTGEFKEDSIFIPVKGKPTNNFVSISTDKSDSYFPGNAVHFTVNSTKRSTVYLLTVDEGILHTQSVLDVNVQEVKSALESYKDQHRNVQLRGGKPEITDISQFPTTCGNDLPSLEQGAAMLMPPPMFFPTGKRVIPKRHYFPRTWMWEEVDMSGKKSVSFIKRIPDTITSWKITAFSINEENGLGVMNDENDVKIQVFQPFFIKVKTPTSIIAGNKAVIQISLFNYKYHQPEKMVILYVWFQERFNPYFIKLNGTGSTLKMHVIETNPQMFGYHNITIAAYDFQNQNPLLDSVAVPFLIKSPGVQQEYSIPKVMSFNSQSVMMKEIVNVSLPGMVISGTEALYIKITGDIVAPSLKGLNKLIRLPCGCGEQTMVYLAPNIYVLQYLKTTKQLSAEMRNDLITKINIGIDSEMRWRRHDGSFSIWGNRNRQGSTWLTSFVLMCFHQANQFVPVKEDVFTSGLKWLMQNQRSDGSIHEPGRVFAYAMQGGARASRVSMTAYVLLTLLELKDFPELKTKLNTVKRKAVQFITNRVSIAELRKSEHGMALTSYVLQKAGYPEKARRLYAELKRMSITNGQYLYWNNKGNRIYKQKLSWQSPHPRARPIDIETTAYALLYLTEKSDLSQGMKIVNWLVSQRNPNGGYSSTQDTVVSLCALSRFCGTLQQANLNVEVKVKTDSTQKTVHVNPRNKLLVHTIELDKNTHAVEIQAQGRGFVLVDTVVKYNVMKSEDSAFEINTTIASLQQTFDEITVNVCVRRKDNIDNGMVVAEIGLPSGFVGDISKTTGAGLEHKETTPDAIILYFKNLRRNRVCFDVKSNRVDKVTESQEVPITVYDYYEPDNYGISSYMTGKLSEMNICHLCPECSICETIVLG
uniref:CD109 antigen-like n=1 Tax=Crassostrea virginica TaxID=6565 RepID=A0A8B8B1X3_CRAVI|nr:CD109 antigen-like [Crassostrea virginica]